MWSITKKLLNFLMPLNIRTGKQGTNMKHFIVVDGHTTEVHILCSVIVLGTFKTKGTGNLFIVKEVIRGTCKSYLENVFISGATVCVIRHIRDYSIFLHSYCPHRHHHLLSRQHSGVQNLRVLQREQREMSFIFQFSFRVYVVVLLSQ